MITIPQGVEVCSLTYRKTCKCVDATASGPRTIRVMGLHRANELIGVIACDECNMPWRMES